MKKLKIFVDMDDVLVDLLNPWLDELNKFSSYTRTYNDIDQWNMEEHYPDLPPSCIYEILSDKIFWSKINAVPDAVTYLKKLIEDGHEVKIATASAPHSFYVKVTNCLLQNFPFLNTRNVWCVHDKSLLLGDILIDDYHENLRHFRGVKILKNAPYNKDCDDSCFHFRVNNWEEIYEIVKEVSNL